jgi:PAS domain S-box-containing protein
MSDVPSSSGTSGSWAGWRLFRVEERRPESETITSFVLRPADGGAIPAHKPGQYLTFLVDVPGKGAQKRNYSISCAPGGTTYRISVKREPEGTVSRWLHDEAVVGTEMKVGAPAGEFVLPDDQPRPVVLLSGGVGLTPLVSMLETIARDRPALQAFYVHGTINGRTHAFGAHVRDLAARSDNIKAATFYSAPGEGDAQGRDFDVAGRIPVEWLRSHVPADADFFICGPVPFLRSFVTGLAASGIAAERIHYEFFGAVEDLLEVWPEALDIAPANTANSWGQEGKKADAPETTREAIGEAFLNGQADAVIVSDREGYITLWNPGAERIFGFTEADAMGQSLDIIIPEGLRARHWEGYRETAASGESRYGAGDLLSVPALCKDGRRISVEFTITMLRDAAGVVIGMIAVLRDVTARFEEAKALKKRLAALEAAGQEATASVASS